MEIKQDGFNVILSNAKDPAQCIMRDSRTSRAQAFFTTFRMTQRSKTIDL